jgi:iron complex transport system ATP-binding protein
VRVERGAFAGLAGPNGSGKTTLLKLVARLHAPAAGLVSIDGRDVTSYSRRDLARLVAGVWQRPALSFGFTARELVLLGRTPYLSPLRWESSEDVAIADAAMEETQIAHLASRIASTLSAGELQRVFIAAALAQKSRVLLLDEPTSFLDRRQAALLSALLRRLIESGVTILCASHDVALLRRHATSVILLEERHAELTNAAALEDWYV